MLKEKQYWFPYINYFISLCPRGIMIISNIQIKGQLILSLTTRLFHVQFVVKFFLYTFFLSIKLKRDKKNTHMIQYQEAHPELRS